MLEKPQQLSVCYIWPMQLADWAVECVTFAPTDVDDGDTVTDYMDQERARGITITSASVTFGWLNHKINLLDTPGHIDFTVEVERSLRVLDGAVAILDGTAGVEAQTLSVWNQANHYGLPRLCFINKMDRSGASLDRSVNAIKTKLKIIPLVTQIPMTIGRDFTRIIDLISLKILKWPNQSQTRRDFEVIPLVPDQGQAYEKSINARGVLLEQLAEIDDLIMDRLVANDFDFCKSDSLTVDEIQTAIARATLSGSAVPVLCGSSLKNRGIQPLLDAIVHYLPSPDMLTNNEVPGYAHELCALAFKIIHDRQRGPLVFLRLYAGTITPNMTVYNVNRDCREKVTRLLTAFADEFKEVSEISAGNIAVAVGLKQTVTGDTLVMSASAASFARKDLEKVRAAVTPSQSSKAHRPMPSMLPVLAGLQVPDPMFFCTVEPASAAYQRDLDNALVCLSREDPSLRVSVDTELAQTVLGGMGELHLDVIAERLRTQYKVDAWLGPLQVAYRESVNKTASHTALARSRPGVSVTLRVTPAPGVGMVEGIEMRKNGAFLPTTEKLSSHYANDVLRAVEEAVVLACWRGPLLSYPVMDVSVLLVSLDVARGTPIPVVTACAAECTARVLTAAETHLMEPIMDLEIVVGEEKLGVVLSDLSTQRRATIREIQSREDTRVILASAPLVTLQGYATSLRTTTSGTASFTMQFSCYAPVHQHLHDQTIRSIRGF
ncbi:ribosome-releasing factor 2, mitochondrial-like isoform X2 [Corticium candelabrum]|uniref:ribosome-releasing factor 2, mitochondrial-like isoform X2 n=1 Tax=Corticium candelabrum TaxID=121492 RepID=UPI002E277053|nr:ribosome-releasing factor 2, mitochondrial-like isoform X2 [Corticium candelabrum]